MNFLGEWLLLIILRPESCDCIPFFKESCERKLMLECLIDLGIGAEKSLF